LSGAQSADQLLLEQQLKLACLAARASVEFLMKDY
jgi:hypothetical protein